MGRLRLLLAYYPLGKCNGDGEIDGDKLKGFTVFAPKLPMLRINFELIRQWRIIVIMIIIETSVFSRLIQELMSGDEYRSLQEALITRPESGDLIKGSNGLRKIRWKLEGQGKRGGVRVIYYWVTADDQIRMLYVYRKSKQADLTQEQIAMLKSIVEKW